MTPADTDELFEERAAIAEHDGGLSRARAEALAAEERMRCEVRYVCAKGADAETYLAQVAQRRGQLAADELRRQAREQYRRGNRGRRGEWYE